MTVPLNRFVKFQSNFFSNFSLFHVFFAAAAVALSHCAARRVFPFCSEFVCVCALGELVRMACTGNMAIERDRKQIIVFDVNLNADACVSSA